MGVGAKRLHFPMYCISLVPSAVTIVGLRAPFVRLGRVWMISVRLMLIYKGFSNDLYRVCGVSGGCLSE